MIGSSFPASDKIFDQIHLLSIYGSLFLCWLFLIRCNVFGYLRKFWGCFPVPVVLLWFVWLIPFWGICGYPYFRVLGVGFMFCGGLIFFFLGNKTYAMFDTFCAYGHNSVDTDSTLRVGISPLYSLGNSALRFPLNSSVVKISEHDIVSEGGVTALIKPRPVTTPGGFSSGNSLPTDSIRLVHTSISIDKIPIKKNREKKRKFHGATDVMIDASKRQLVSSTDRCFHSKTLEYDRIVPGRPRFKRKFSSSLTTTEKGQLISYIDDTFVCNIKRGKRNGYICRSVADQLQVYDKVASSADEPCVSDRIFFDSMPPMSQYCSGSVLLLDVQKRDSFGSDQISISYGSQVSVGTPSESNSPVDSNSTPIGSVGVEIAAVASIGALSEIGGKQLKKIHLPALDNIFGSTHVVPKSSTPKGKPPTPSSFASTKSVAFGIAFTDKSNFLLGSK